MNKQELIEKIKGLKHHFENKSWVDRELVLDLVKQLDEPQKPVVPQFVADWYEKHKYNFEFNIWDYVYMFDEKDESYFTEWLNDSNTDSFQTLVNMHQFGYEVEKEKRYFVRLKHAGISNSLLKRTPKGEWWFGINFDDESQAHTRKELEDAGFGEVFNSPLFQVEEVE